MIDEKEADRFWSKVDVGQWDECWPWTAGKEGKGYGTFWGNGGQMRAHRVAYELLVGPIPDGLTIDHVEDWGCGNKMCCNPTHMEPVTAGENVRRAMRRRTHWANSAKTHCPQGHEYTPENTYAYGSPRNGQRRECRTCTLARLARRRAARGR